MSAQEERIEVLRMVAEGVISVEEGEKLLAALGKGEEGEGLRGASPLDEVGRGIAGMGRGFAGVGRSIALAVDQAVRGALRKSGTERTGLSHESDLEIPAGTALLIESSAVGEGSILIEGGAGERGRIRCEAEHRVSREEGRVRVEWPGGDIRVQVPEAVSRVTARAHHGHVRVRDLAAPLEVETLHGHLELRGIRRRFEAETLAGNVLLEVGALDGDSALTTMAGCVEVVLAPDFTGTIRASTLGGEITLGEGIGRVVQPPVGRVPTSAVIEVGEPPGAAALELETAGGSIVIRRSS